MLLRLTLPCSPDAAWRAVRSPAELQAVYAPLIRFTSRDPGGFPVLWEPGEHRIAVRLLRVPLGEQVSRLAFDTGRPDGVRIMRDTGHGAGGVLAIVRDWDHRMAIAPAPAGGTLYRDRLRFRAGPLTALLWPGYWLLWQWRALRLRTRSRRWR